MPDPEQTLIAINKVAVDRAEEFEGWLRAVVVPAMRNQRPDLEGRWQVLRSTEADDRTVVFAFVCQGGTSSDWELDPLLEKELGPEGAERALEEFSELLLQDQEGWFFTPARMDGP